jgi:integrase
MTIDQIYLQYIPTKELTLAPKTVMTYKSAYEKHIKSVFGHKNIKTIHYIDYQKFADKLIVSGLKPKTVSNFLKFLSSLYTFAIKNDYYSGTIYPREVELPKFDNKYYVTFSAAIQKKYLLLLKNADTPILKYMFLFLLHGRRLGEVINLEWQYLDLNQGIVYYPASHNKAKRFLSYELTTELITVLKIQHAKAITRQGTVFPTGYVFLNPDTNKRFSDTYLRDTWSRMLKRANLPYTKLHNIRHILGTYLVNELQLPLETVSYVLGHHDTAITKRYVHIKPVAAKNAIDALFDDFKSKGEKYVENLDQVIRMGECVQTFLFPNQKSMEVTK